MVSSYPEDRQEQGSGMEGGRENQTNCLRIVCGAPASGKSTYARELAATHTAAILDIDTVTEPLVRATLLAAERDEFDRDSEQFKRVYREAIYETLFAIAEENLSFVPVIVVGPFTRELQRDDWPDTLERRFGVPVEVFFVFCSAARRKKRMIERANPRDQGKLADWERHLDYVEQVSQPRFPCVLVNSETGEVSDGAVPSFKES